MANVNEGITTEGGQQSDPTLDVNTEQGFAASVARSAGRESAPDKAAPESTPTSDPEHNTADEIRQGVLDPDNEIVDVMTAISIPEEKQSSAPAPEAAPAQTPPAKTRPMTAQEARDWSALSDFQDLGEDGMVAAVLDPDALEDPATVAALSKMSEQFKWRLDSILDKADDLLIEEAVEAGVDVDSLELPSETVGSRIDALVAARTQAENAELVGKLQALADQQFVQAVDEHLALLGIPADAKAERETTVEVDLVIASQLLGEGASQVSNARLREALADVRGLARAQATFDKEEDIRQEFFNTEDGSLQYERVNDAGELVPLTPRPKRRAFSDLPEAEAKRRVEKAKQEEAALLRKVTPSSKPPAQALRDELTKPERTSVADGLTTPSGENAYDVMARKARADQERERRAKAAQLGIHRGS